MSRRRTAVVGAVLALVVALASGRSAPRAAAVAPDLSGWWNALNTGLLGITPDPPPTVPENGLYVAGNPFAALPDIPLPATPDNPLSQLASPTGGQQAIAALRWVLAPGRAPGTLRLQVAGAAPAPPTTALVACPLTFGAFPAGGNQPWAQRPAYDCTKAEVAGKVAADGRSVSWDLGRVAPVDDVVAVALLPAGAADQVAFDAPGPDSLTVTGDAAPATSVPVDVGLGPTVDLPPPVAPLGGVPLTIPEAAPPVAPPPPAPPAARPRVAAPASSSEDDDDGRAIGVALALVFAAALAHVHRADRDVTARPGPRGIGRFARDRAGAPPPL